MTDAERAFWKLLKSSGLDAWKFRRQHPIGRYVVDFACDRAALIIEVDGGQHCEDTSDAVRTAWLEGCGWRVLRFWNNEVLQQSESVHKTVESYLKPTLTHPALPVDLSHRGEVNQVLSI